MKRIFSALLALVMIVSLVGCAESKSAAPEPTPAPESVEQPSAGLPNPVVTVADYAALVSAQPTIKLNIPPQGSENVTYSYINNIPVIAQIAFRYNGADYVYRAAFGGDNNDISGVYSVLPNVVSARFEPENAAGGPYTLRYDEATGEAVANWNTALSGCRYSLYTDSGYKGESSDFLTLVGALYSCTPDARSANGTVNSIQNGTLVVTLEDGRSAVLDCVNVPRMMLEPNDIITFNYVGDLASNAYLVSAIKTGVHEEGPTFYGTIELINDDYIFVLTDDNNIFVFNVADAKITGKSDVLQEGYTVIIHYTGDLYGEPVATLIEITDDAPITPVPTAEPIDRSTSGKVTSVAGNYVTVNGICFNVSGKIVSGTPTVGYNATIYFVDYGNGSYVVSSAYFDVPAPQTYTTSGTVTSVYKANANDWYFTVNGLYIHLNTRGVGGDGAALAEGAWAYVEYKVENGMNEATFVNVTPPQPTPAPTPVPTPEPEPVHYDFNGTVTSHSLNGGAIVFTLASGARYHAAVSSMSGQITDGCNAYGSAYQKPDGYDWYVDYVTFEGGAPEPTPAPAPVPPAPTPEPAPEPQPARISFDGTVTSHALGGGALKFTLSDGNTYRAAMSSINGQISDGCNASGTAVQNNSGDWTCETVTFTGGQPAGLAAPAP